MTANESLYQSNLDKWKFLNASVAERLSRVVCKEVSLCQNADGKLNLVKNVNGIREYFHSQTNPEKEAVQWFLNLDVKNTTVVYVYGIGLGYYYDVIKDWLKEDKVRHLIFLEDNLEVIKCFLGTEQAEKILNDPQVSIFHFTWDESYAYFAFSFITALFTLATFKVTALQYYDKANPQRVSDLYSKIAYFHEGNLGSHVEFLNPNSIAFVLNYYADLLELPEAKQGYEMVNQFKGIPAIICGAGPSLEKNRDQLNALKDKALIMAGGTAMNVLNAAGIIPHFGVGIDPNTTHYNRLIANVAFETPFFYRNRMFNPALKLIHGEKVFLNGAGGYKVAGWFEESLGIPTEDVVEEGHNVVNFNVAIARALGCNPILVVGVDLAYSNNSSYASGIVNHALQDPKNAFITRSKTEKLLVKNDIYGNPVQTLWKWVKESLWYSEFATNNPQITFLNCTEGGIGFNRVLDADLKDAARLYLNKSYDMQSLIHGLIQNSPPPKELTVEKIIDTLKLFSTSLLKSLSLGKNIVQDLNEKIQRLNEGEPVEDLEANLKENIEVFNEEIAVKHFLSDYSTKYIDVLLPHHRYIECNPQFCSPEEAKKRRVSFDIHMYSHMLRVANTNVILIARTLQSYAQYNRKINLKPLKRVLDLQLQLEAEIEESKKHDQYSYEDDLLTVIDPELQMDYKNKVSLIKETSLYPSGKVKMQQYRLGRELHGPVTFFTEEGGVLSQSWYINDRKEGKAWNYYPDGTLYSLNRYKNNLQEGRQEYYHSTGSLKSVLNYAKGQLHGMVLLLHPNGRLKREMYFKDGKREGLERMWNSDAFLLQEAYYKEDVPVGIAKEWYLNGKLAKEINYDEPSESLRTKTWTAEGILIKADERKDQDYFESMTNTAQLLNSALSNVFQSLVRFSPNIADGQTDSQDASINKDLVRLKDEMLKLDALNEKLTQARGLIDTKQKEPIWKSPEMESMMREKMEEICNKLNETMEIAHEKMKIISDNVEHKISADKNKEQLSDDKKK
jgi:antitoxin component YwqK of YwqJK toxin-antitoxin module